MIKTVIVIVITAGSTNLQSEFDIAAKRAKELVYENPDEVAEVQLQTNSKLEPSIILMNVYTDFDEDFNNGGDSVHIWYDKEALDKLNIKY